MRRSDVATGVVSVSFRPDVAAVVVATEAIMEASFSRACSITGESEAFLTAGQKQEPFDFLNASLPKREKSASPTTSGPEVVIIEGDKATMGAGSSLE